MITTERDNDFLGAYRAILYATKRAHAGLEYYRPIRELRYLAKCIGLQNLKDVAEPFRKLGTSPDIIDIRPRKPEERSNKWPSAAKIIRDIETIEFGRHVLNSKARTRRKAYEEAWEAMGHDAVDHRAHTDRFRRFREICEDEGCVPIFGLQQGFLAPLFSLSDVAPEKAGRKPKRNREGF